VTGFNWKLLRPTIWIFPEFIQMAGSLLRPSGPPSTNGVVNPNKKGLQRKEEASGPRLTIGILRSCSQWSGVCCCDSAVFAKRTTRCRERRNEHCQIGTRKPVGIEAQMLRPAVWIFSPSSPKWSASFLCAARRPRAEAEIRDGTA
jgi:hypothetical protein